MKPIDFITALRESDFYIQHLYTEGSCYQFYVLLKKMYPESIPYINIHKNHVVTKIDNFFYDINGVVVNTKVFKPLDKKDLRLVEKWSFQKNNLLKIDECPYCEESLIYEHEK